MPAQQYYTVQLNVYLCYNRFIVNVMFRTVLSPEICIENMEPYAEKREWHSDISTMFLTGKELSYKINGDKFQIKRVRPFVRNSLQVTLFGEFETTNNGTLIKGKYVMDRFGIGFVIFWEVAVLSICLFLVFSKILSLMQSPLVPQSMTFSNDIFPWLIVLLLPFGGLGIYMFGKARAKEDAQVINQFIENTCSAVIVKHE